MLQRDRGSLKRTSKKLLSVRKGKEIRKLLVINDDKAI